MTIEQFARWSFIRDQEAGLYPITMAFEEFSEDEREVFLEEAEYYLTLPQDEWPSDILDRL